MSTSAEPTKFCQHCGAQIAKEAEICPRCGVRVAFPQPAEIKNAGIAAVLSAIIPGIGQIYNGQIGKGILFVILGVILLVSIVFLIGIIFYPIFWIINIYDAYRTAKRINQGLIKPE